MSLYAEMERVFARHGLGAVLSVEPLSGGQLNSAARVNGQYVIRCRDAAFATGSLRREAVLLTRLRGRVPVPQPVATGVHDILGEYLIETWVPGRTLLRAWLDTPDVTTREWWTRDWIAALQALHAERFPHPGELPDGELKGYPSWRACMESRVRKRLDQLARLPAANRSFVIAVEKYFRRHAPVLEDGPFCLIHRDLHFGNVLVDGPHLAAILDFELAESGPPDYELDTIYRFLRYPWLFVEPAEAAEVTPSRFATVWGRLKRAYPELFAVRHLRQRLCLYALDRDLSALVQAYSGRAGGTGLDAILGRLEEILQDRYGPE